ncbi:MAG: hypothetical protein IT350_08190 [Deltaproteobacteria bacterium]|nr:hypothetical protein [Deltaproteobacteria bacterium]
MTTYSRWAALFLFTCLVSGPFLGGCGGGDDDDSPSSDFGEPGDDDARDDDVADDDSTDDDALDDDTTDDDYADDDSLDDDTADDDTEDDDAADDDTGPCEPRLHAYDGFEDYPVGLWRDHGDWLLVSEQVEVEKIRRFDSSRGLKALHVGGMWLAGLEDSKYIWQELIGYDLPTDTCDVFWIEIDGKSWITPGNGGIAACVAPRFGYPDSDTICAGTDIRAFWTNFKLKIDKVSRTVDVYVDDELQGTTDMEADYPVFMFQGASVWGGYYVPHIAMDEFSIYDDGYER